MKKHSQPCFKYKQKPELLTRWPNPIHVGVTLVNAKLEFDETVAYQQQKSHCQIFLYLIPLFLISILKRCSRGMIFILHLPSFSLLRSSCNIAGVIVDALTLKVNEIDHETTLMSFTL